jgi:NitT/TauT family transport system substrate-binding protein
MGRGRTRASAALAAVVALVLGIAACGDTGTEGEAGDITVTNHPALLYSPPWIAATEDGLLEQRGVRVGDIVGSEGGGTTVRNVVSGGLPIGEVATTAAITAYMAGADIKIVGGGVGSSEDVFWVTRPDSDIESIEDLEGKEVGYTSPGSVTQGLLTLSLERSGVGVDNVKTRSMGGLPEGLTALKNGDIDAAAILEPVYSEQVAEERWKPVFRAEEYVPEFLSTVIISGPGVLERDRALVAGTVAARAEAIGVVKREPERVAKAWAKEAEISPSSALKALRSVDPDKHWVVGLRSTKALETVVEEMRLIDLLPAGQDVDWNGLVNQEMVPPDERIRLPGGS